MTWYFDLIQEKLTHVLNETLYPFFPSKLTDIIEDELEQFWKHKVVDVYSKEFPWKRNGYGSHELMVTWVHAQDLAQDQTRQRGCGTSSRWSCITHPLAAPRGFRSFKKWGGIWSWEESQVMGGRQVIGDEGDLMIYFFKYKNLK